MVRTSAGLRPAAFARCAWAWLACAVLCLSAAAPIARAQEETPESPPSAEEQWVPIAPDALSALSAAPSPEERAALLASGDAAALQTALDQAKTRLEQLAEAMPAINRDIREFRQKAMRDSEKAKEIRAKIKVLEDELAAYADNLPEVRERQDALDAINRNLMDELRFRRELARKLGHDISRPFPAQQPILEP